MKLHSRLKSGFITLTALSGGLLPSAMAQQKPYSLPGTGLPVPPPAPKAVAPATPPTTPTPPTPAAATATAAAPSPAQAAEQGTLNSFLNGKLPEAIGKSKISIDARLRWEFADQQPIGAGPELKESNAITLRTRFGLTTAPLYHFQAMIEGENVAVIGPADNYNAAGSNGQGDRTVIPDPPTTELNQAWVSYSNWDTTVKAGRQRLVLDNHRFVGDVGWRQNMQTYDLAGIENKSLKDLALYYGYIWDVHRVFGDVDGLPAANRDFSSDSHVVNASWTGWKYGRFVGYSYLFDLENSAAASRNNSTASYGGYFAGSTALTDTLSIGYRAEFAWQTDYGNSPLDYQAEYYNIEAGASMKPFAVGAGYEVLGSDNGQGFKTPLATLHAFNGWADVFLATPPNGLQDIYAYAQYSILPDMPFRFVFHQYNSDTGGRGYGQEYDFLITKKLGKHWSTLAKYAHYVADEGPYADVNKFWFEVTFTY